MSSTQSYRGVVFFLGVLLLGTPFPAHGDIYRWDTGAVIPGTEGIEPGPGVDLRGWNTDGHHLRYADFSGGMDLVGAKFGSDSDDLPGIRGSWLDHADFSGANLTEADFDGIEFLAGGCLGCVNDGASLTDANFTDAVISGAGFCKAQNFTEEQLYSTSSYQNKDLRGIRLGGQDLSGWDFSGQDLRGAVLGGQVGSCDSTAILTDADFAGAIIAGTTLMGPDFTEAQLYSTASYQSKNLRGIRLLDLELSGWDFSGQDLRDAAFGDSYFVGAGAHLTFESTLNDANLTGARLNNAVLCGRFVNASLTRADLTGATAGCGFDLIGANFSRANVKGANLTGVEVGVPWHLGSPFWNFAIYNQWTKFSADADPEGAFLIFVESPAGDFDMDDVLDADDVDVSAERIRLGYVDSNGYWNDAMFDVNGDNLVDYEDHRSWVKNLKHTWYGDADLNGEFNSSDMVHVYDADKYETAEEASWSEGDWNADGFFNSGDMVTAFADGGYEKGPMADVVVVPEPAGLLLLILATVTLLISRRDTQ